MLLLENGATFPMHVRPSKVGGGRQTVSLVGRRQKNKIIIIYTLGEFACFLLPFRYIDAAATAVVWKT